MKQTRQNHRVSFCWPLYPHFWAWDAQLLQFPPLVLLFCLLGESCLRSLSLSSTFEGWFSAHIILDVLFFFVKNISLLKVVYCFICMVCWEVDSNSFHCSSVVKMCFFPCLLQDFPLLLLSWSLNETCSCLDVIIFIPYGVCWVYHICSLFCLSLILEVSQSLLFYISAILSSWFFWYIMYSWPLKSPVSR